jgi:hypothetical protein
MLYYRIILHAPSIPETQKTQISRVDFHENDCICVNINCEVAATRQNSAKTREHAAIEDQKREKVLFYMRIRRKQPVPDHSMP